jgi:hypothetical protein
MAGRSKEISRQEKANRRVAQVKTRQRRRVWFKSCERVAIASLVCNCQISNLPIQGQLANTIQD